MVIGTNIAALSAAMQLSDSTQRLNQSLARLSSGSQLTSAADDPAAAAESMQLTAQIGQSQAAASNVSNALSFAQTQDGYLQGVESALGRMSELAVGAQDETLSTTQRSADNQEFQGLLQYVNNVQTKDFNGVSLFGSTGLTVTTDPSGAGFTATGVAANYLPASQINPAPASDTLATVDPAMTADVYVVTTLANGDQDAMWAHTSDSISTLAANLNNLMNASGATGTPVSYNSSTGALAVAIPAGMQLSFNLIGGAATNLLGITNGESDNRTGSSTDTVSVTLGTSSGVTYDLNSVAHAASAATSLTTALNQVATDRATVGAGMERLNYTANELESLRTNLAAANSTLADVDVAAESTNYARQSILVQSSTAMLAQANTAAQSILKLLS